MRKRPNEARLTKPVTCPSCKATWKVRADHPPRRCKYCRAQLTPDPPKVDKKLGIPEQFQAYLSTGRTLREIQAKFGPDVEPLLAAEYPGYYLFRQRNLYNEPVFILLPEYRDDIKIKPRDWHYHKGVSDDGIDQPYIVVQLPDDAFVDDRLVVVPLADVHSGHVAHRREKFLSYIRWISEAKNIYWVGLGDLAENALDDGRGMSYEQDQNPASQMDELRRLLAPIAHKCLVMLPGNHEWRTYKHTGIDPTRYLAERLDIPYFDGPVWLSLLVGGYKWLFHVEHGRTSSQTKGGKLNAAGAARRFASLVHFFISAHTHDPLINSEVCIVEDPVNCRLVEMQQWIVVASSFLRYAGTYAWRAGYAPPGVGGVTCEMTKTGEYRAILK